MSVARLLLLLGHLVGSPPGNATLCTTMLFQIARSQNANVVVYQANLVEEVIAIDGQRNGQVLAERASR